MSRGFTWRISGPHISTVENLHAKQKRAISILLRAKMGFLAKKDAKLKKVWEKIFLARLSSVGFVL